MAMSWHDRGVSLHALDRLRDDVQAVSETHPCPEVRRWAAICRCEIDQVLLRAFWLNDRLRRLDAALACHRARESD